MEDSQKKQAMLGIVVGCFVVAAGVWWFTKTPGQKSIEQVFKGQTTWLKCESEQCGHEYQMDLNEYIKQQLELQKKNPGSIEAAPLVCPKCGKEDVYKAVKCPYCQTVFFWGSAGKNDFADRCTKCGKSAMQEKRKAKAAS